MTYSMITNIKHLIPDDPSIDLPTPARKLKDFLGSIVMAGTASREPVLLSALLCRKRVNRKCCPGLIEVKRQDLPSMPILWHCSECEDGGVVTMWEKSYCDLTSQTPRQTSNAEDPELEIFISLEEHATLRAGGIYDPDCERMLYGAPVTLKGVLIRGLESDFDNWIGHLAADAHREPRVKRRKLLDAVYEKASGALDDSILWHKE